MTPHKPSYKLDNEEFSLCYQVAHKRDQAHDNEGNMVDGSAERYFVHMVGAVGEYALSQYLGITWPQPVFSREEWLRRFGQAIDFPGIEVRTSYTDYAYLNVFTKDHTRPIKYYVKCRNDRENKKLVLFVGWVPYTEAITDKYKADKRYPWAKGVTHLVPDKELRPIEELREMVGS